MNGVVRLMLVIFGLSFVVLIAPATLEPIGETVKEHDSIETVGGDAIIDDMYAAIFARIPLVFLGGMMVWAAAWYLRRERFIGRR